MTKKIYILHIVFGIIFLVYSGFIFFLSSSDEYLYSINTQEKTLLYNEVIGSRGEVERGTIYAVLSLESGFGGEVTNGSSFIYKLDVELEHSQYQSNDGVNLFPGETLSDFINSKLVNGGLSFSMHLAGAEVQPIGPVTVPKSGILQWSIKPSTSGTLEGFIKPEFPKRVKRSHVGNFSLQYTVEDYFPISVKVVDSFLTTKNVISAIVAFMGSLITLPGILGLYKDRKKRKNAKPQDDLKIIIP